MTTRDQIMQRLASAQGLGEQMQLVAELDALDAQSRKTAAAERSLDWADTTVRQTLAPGRTLDRHTAATDWLAETDTDPGENHHHAVIAEASVWFQRLDPDVKADAGEFVEQAKGIARRTAGKYGTQAEAAADAFLQYVAFLNRQVLAASGLPQIQQRVDSFENQSPTPLPTDVFDNFAPPVHPINSGVDGQQTNSLAPGAEEAMAENNGSPVGRPSEHEDDQDPVSQPQFMPPSAKQGGRKVAGALERAKDMTARKGHAMNWEPANGADDAWMGRCAGCGASVGVTTAGIVKGSTAHSLACTNRSHGSLAAPSLAIGYTGMTMDDYLQAEASKEGGAAPFVREAERGGGDDDGSMPGGDLASFNESRDPDNDGDDDSNPRGDIDHDHFDEKGDPRPNRRRSHSVRKDAASGLDQVQQTVDSFENKRPTSLPLDVMFPIDQDWPEEQAAYDKGGETQSGGTGRPSAHNAVRKQADMFGGGDSPHAAPGSETPVANSPATTPPRAGDGDFNKGVAQGQADAAAGERPSFADNSSKVSDFVRGYVQGYGTGPQSSNPQDVPGSMGGDNGQGRNFAETQARTEQPMLNMASKGGLTVSAALVAKDVSQDADFQRGYRYARSWEPGQQVVAMGSKGEEAGIYAGITDNPQAQRAWVVEHRKMSSRYPELETRLRQHKLVTANLRERNDELLVKGLYVQAATSLDLDTMSPVTSPDPQGATPSEGPGTIPPLRGAPGSPAAPGGPAPYNGVEPLGQPVVPDPLMTEPEPGGIPMLQPHSPDAVNMTGDSSLLSKSPATMAFRRKVQANKLALRQKKEN